jgi:predicted permease
LIGSGLVARSYEKLRSVDPGFDPTNLMTFGLLVSGPRHSGPDAAELYLRLVDRLRALPDVESAAVTTFIPFFPDAQMNLGINVEDFPERKDAFMARFVTPGFFETMRIPIVAGRTMLPEDADQLRFFVTESFAERYWGTASAVGRRIGPTRNNLAEVVGVVGNDRALDLSSPIAAGFYAPLAAATEFALGSVSVFVRTRGIGTDLVPLFRREVAALDPELPLLDIRWMEDVIAESDAVSRANFATLLFVLAAAVALLLGAVGIHGMIAYVVSLGTVEIGIRRSLGATSGDIWSRVVGAGLVPAIVGAGVGLAAAAVGSRILTSLLFETSPFDTTSFVAGPTALLLVAAAACILPARRALRIEPVRALRIG